MKNIKAAFQKTFSFAGRDRKDYTDENYADKTDKNSGRSKSTTMHKSRNDGGTTHANAARGYSSGDGSGSGQAERQAVVKSGSGRTLPASSASYASNSTSSARTSPAYPASQQAPGSAQHHSIPQLPKSDRPSNQSANHHSSISTNANQMHMMQAPPPQPPPPQHQPQPQPQPQPQAAAPAQTQSKSSTYQSVTIAVAEHCPFALYREKWSLEDFELKKQMYAGQISLVYHAVDKRSGISVALKLYRRAKLNEMERHQVAREIKLHIELNHSSIIALYAAWKDRNYVYLALEWAPGGDVYTFLKAQGGKLTEDVAVPLILEPFLSAIKYIHDLGLIHRDIKPENILLNSSFQIKIADFGLSIDSKNEIANTRLGTIDYLAPEILDCPVKSHPMDNKDKPHIGYSNKVDCWSVGVLAYEVLVGRPPFEAMNAHETLKRIKYKKVDYPPELSPGAVDFMTMALVRDPEQRGTIDMLLNHPWIRAFTKKRENLAQRNRTRRSRTLGLSGMGLDTVQDISVTAAASQRGTTSYETHSSDPYCTSGHHGSNLMSTAPAAVITHHSSHSHTGHHSGLHRINSAKLAQHQQQQLTPQQQAHQQQHQHHFQQHQQQHQHQQQQQYQPSARTLSASAGSRPMPPGAAGGFSHAMVKPFEGMDRPPRDPSRVPTFLPSIGGGHGMQQQMYQMQAPGRS